MYQQVEKERKLKNDKYDEVVEVSQSLDQTALSAAPKPTSMYSDSKDLSKGLAKGSEQTKSQSVLNKPFDEALEFSHSGSEESVDTRASHKEKLQKIEKSEMKPMEAINRMPEMPAMSNQQKAAPMQQV